MGDGVVHAYVLISFLECFLSVLFCMLCVHMSLSCMSTIGRLVCMCVCACVFMCGEVEYLAYGEVVYSFGKAVLYRFHHGYHLVIVCCRQHTSK